MQEGVDRGWCVSLTVTGCQLLQALFNDFMYNIYCLACAEWLIYGWYMHKQATFTIHIQGVQINITAEKVTHIFGYLRCVQRFISAFIRWGHAIHTCCIYSLHNLINI